MEMLRSQASARRRPASLYYVCFLFFVITVAALNEPVSAYPRLTTKRSSSPPTTLVIYEHEDRVPPGRTIVTAASPSGNLSADPQFGTINVISNVLREGQAGDSPVIGKAKGQVTFEDDGSITLAFLFVLNTTKYAGSLTVQGTLDSEGNGEVVITGGTYDFRWARGYAEVLTVSSADQNDVVFKNTLYLKYD